MRLRSTGVVSLTAAALLLVPAGAGAKLPSPTTKRIVPGRSIGGVKLGMEAKTAVEKWGPGGTCAEAIGNSCSWQGTPRQGAAVFIVEDGRVASVHIEVGSKPNDLPAYSGPITKWKTAKRIGIGSRLRSVTKAYPKARPDPSGVVLRSGGRRTLFESSLGRVASITIDRGEE
jgi:hypothetical protein